MRLVYGADIVSPNNYFFVAWASLSVIFAMDLPKIAGGLGKQNEHLAYILCRLQ